MAFSMLGWMGGSWDTIDLTGYEGSGSPWYMDSTIGAWNSKRIWRFSIPDSTSLSSYVRLPDATTLPVGGPIAYLQQIRTSSPGRHVYLRDYGNNAVGRVENPSSSGENKCILLLLDNSTQDGVWAVLECRETHLQRTT